MNPAQDARTALQRLEASLKTWIDDGVAPPFGSVDVGATLVFGPVADAEEISDIERSLDVVLPEDYIAFLTQYGPFGIAEEGDGFSDSVFRLLTTDEVVEVTQELRATYDGILEDELLADVFPHLVFFRCVDWESNESYFGFNIEDYTVRRLKHDEVDLLTNPEADSFTDHIEQWVAELLEHDT